jgi:methionine-rich copper-binding protein CopC
MKAVLGETRALPHLVAALLLGAWVSVASAHALLNKSDPARRAVLSKPPTGVRLWFNERLEAAFSTLSVLDTNGKPVTQDPAHVSTEDPKLIELQLPPLEAGTYTVKYKVLSVDGHTVKASYTFTIKGR